MITFGSTVLGGQNASVIRPIPDEVRVLRDQIFTSSGPLGPLAKGQTSALMLEENARIRILNGTSSHDLETRARIYLTKRGMIIPETGLTKAQSRTTIVLYSPKLYTLRFLQDIFEITRSPQILIQPDPNQTVDIEIRLGPDWVGKLPAE
jgi:polyisoprenyl-teichoic acid--peptidoglycan teichoic acid transferase